MIFCVPFTAIAQSLCNKGWHRTLSPYRPSFPEGRNSCLAEEDVVLPSSANKWYTEGIILIHHREELLAVSQSLLENGVFPVVSRDVCCSTIRTKHFLQSSLSSYRSYLGNATRPRLQYTIISNTTPI